MLTSEPATSTADRATDGLDPLLGLERRFAPTGIFQMTAEIKQRADRAPRLAMWIQLVMRSVSGAISVWGEKSL